MDLPTEQGPPVPPANEDHQCPLQTGTTSAPCNKPRTLTSFSRPLILLSLPAVEGSSAHSWMPSLATGIIVIYYIRFKAVLTVETLIWGCRKISWTPAFATFKLFALEKLIYLSEPQPQFPQLGRQYFQETPGFVVFQTVITDGSFWKICLYHPFLGREPCFQPTGTLEERPLELKVHTQ